MSRAPHSSIAARQLGLVAVAIAALLPVNSPAQEPARFKCEVPVKAPLSVRAAGAEYYACVTPLTDQWLARYPAEVRQLEALYEAWLRGTEHDLRLRPQEAAEWVSRHRTDFSEHDVALTPEQVQALAPPVHGELASVAGTFERLSVDRDNRRLFLTSSELGLVSVSITERYAFDVEGSADIAGAREFVVYDATTAFVEEHRGPADGAADGATGGNADLVVLDISDRAKPREMARLRGALPRASHRLYPSHIELDDAPGFDEYLAIRRGHFAPEACGPPPSVSMYPRMRCRPDGSCYRTEYLATPEGMCVRASSHTMRDVALSGRGTNSSINRPAVSPRGRADGAGSLSQMLVYGTTLYVLSGVPRHPHGWLTTFDVSNPRRPKVRHVIALDNAPEALHRHDNLLLVAGRDALITASVAEPTRPRLLGQYRGPCRAKLDPVTVRGSVAYRTILLEPSTSTCQSRLEVIDLSEPHNPQLRTTLPLSRPRGLAVLGHRLFVADEPVGVQVFDLNNPASPRPAGTLALPGVRDLVVSDFDLFAMAPQRVDTFDVAPLYEQGLELEQALERVTGHTTVRPPDVIDRIFPTSPQASQPSP